MHLYDYLCTYPYVRVQIKALVAVRSQLLLVNSLLKLCGSQGSNIHQIWGKNLYPLKHLPSSKFRFISGSPHPSLQEGNTKATGPATDFTHQPSSVGLLVYFTTGIILDLHPSSFPLVLLNESWKDENPLTIYVIHIAMI